MHSPVSPRCCRAGGEIDVWLCGRASASQFQQLRAGTLSDAFLLFLWWGGWDQAPVLICILLCYPAQTTYGSVELLDVFIFTQIPKKLENASVCFVLQEFLVPFWVGKSNTILAKKKKIPGSVTLQREC